jgi:hypothetical protein
LSRDRHNLKAALIRLLAAAFVVVVDNDFYRGSDEMENGEDE